MVSKLRCKRCGHEWISLKEGYPLTCPKCKRYDWRKEEVRKYESNNNRVEHN